MNRECWNATLIVLSSASAMCILLSIVLGLAAYEWMWRIISSVQTKLGGLYADPQHNCWLCGMSRAFRAIWNGSIEHALTLNPYSLYLFWSMIAGCITGPVLWGILGARSLRDGR